MGDRERLRRELAARLGLVGPTGEIVPLEEGQRTFLDEAVEAALAAHAGDPGRTFATLGGATLLPPISAEPSLTVETTSSRTAAGLAVTPEIPDRYRKAGPDLGRGGIGRVLLYFDEHLGREVAVKQLLYGPGPPGSHGTSSREARFLREARVTGSLEHPNIVPVHELGVRRDGSLYYTMKVVRGRTLARALAACHTLVERLRLLPHVVDLCQAVAYAHSRGVVHRDVKPDNVMLGEFGETVVLDWGLAKVRGQEDLRGGEVEERVSRLMDTGHTVSGRALGTPHYMSPEAAAGAVDEVDERSDVWSLGVVLYELLAARVPFEGEPVPEIFVTIQEGIVPPVRGVCPEVPAELAAVCHKALCRDPEQRYAHAGELAEELELWLTGARVTAYEYGSMELLARFARRQRVPLAVAGVGLALLLALGGASWRRVVLEHRTALEHLASSQLEAAEASLAQGDRVRARALLRHSLELDDTVRARVLVGRLDRDPLVWSRTLLSKVHALDWSHDGRWLAVADDSRLLTLVDALTAAEQEPRYLGEMANAVVFSPDDRHIATGGYEGTVRLYPTLQGEPRELEGATGRVTDVAFSRDGAVLAAGDEAGIITWDVATGEVLARHALEHPVLHVDIGPGGQVAAGDVIGGVWLVEGDALRALPYHGSEISGLAISPEGMLATASMDGELRLWLGLDGQYTEAEDASTPAVRLAWSADGLLASGGTGGQVFLWRDGALVATLREASLAQARALSFDPSGGRLAVGARDRTLEVHALEATPLPLRGHPDVLTAVVLDEAGATAFTAGHDPELRAWDLATGTQVGVLTGHDNNILALARSSTGLLASGSRDGTLRVWNPDTGSLVRLLHHGTAVYAVDFSPDGRLVVGGDYASHARVWEVESGSQVASLDHGGPMVYQARFTEDGGLLTSAGASIWQWAPDTFAPVRTLDTPLVHVDTLVPAPDGGLLVGHWGEDLLLYRGGEVERTFTFPHLISAAFSPEGDRLALAGHGAEVLHLGSDRRDGVLYGAYARGLAWSPDGAALYVGGQHLEAWSPTGDPLWGGWYAAPTPEGGQCARTGHTTGEYRDASGAVAASWTHERPQGWYDEGYPPYPAHMSLLPVAGGCVTMESGEVQLHRPGREPALLSEGRPGQLFPWGEDIGILAGAELVRVDPSGAEVARVELPGSASAAFATSLGLVVGLDDRTLALVGEGGGHHLLDVPLDVLVAAVDGPAGTLILGTMAGDVLLVHPGDGILDRARLNGIVQTVVLEGSTVRVSTSSADHLEWDLSALSRDWCGLLREVWEQVPLRMEGSRVVEGGPPAGHPCFPRR